MPDQGRDRLFHVERVAGAVIPVDFPFDRLTQRLVLRGQVVETRSGGEPGKGHGASFGPIAPGAALLLEGLEAQEVLMETDEPDQAGVRRRGPGLIRLGGDLDQGMEAALPRLFDAQRRYERLHSSFRADLVDVVAANRRVLFDSAQQLGTFHGQPGLTDIPGLDEKLAQPVDPVLRQASLKVIVRQRRKEQRPGGCGFDRWPDGIPRLVFIMGPHVDHRQQRIEDRGQGAVQVASGRAAGEILLRLFQVIRFALLEQPQDMKDADDARVVLRALAESPSKLLKLLLEQNESLGITAFHERDRPRPACRKAVFVDPLHVEPCLLKPSGEEIARAQIIIDADLHRFGEELLAGQGQRRLDDLLIRHEEKRVAVEGL